MIPLVPPILVAAADLFAILDLLVTGTLGVAASILALATLLSFLPLEAWWAAGTRYARLQLAALGIVLMVIGIASGSWPLSLVAVLCTLPHLAVMGIYAMPPWGDTWERPHTHDSAGPEATGDATASLRVMTLNVQRDNPDRERIRELLARVDVDVVLLIEVTRGWLDALRPALTRFERDGVLHAVESPSEDDHYGMALYSALPIHDAAVDKFGCKGRIGIKVVLETPDGPVEIWGLHPEPPHPGQSARPKDVYLLDAGERMAIDDDHPPRIVLGDLNDVAWSAATQTFLERAQLIDPRPGRGMFCTFHADSWLARWPIDHVFHDARLRCDRIEVLPPVGSDHHPVTATFCIAPATRQPGRVSRLTAPGPKEEAHEEAREVAVAARARS